MAKNILINSRIKKEELYILFFIILMTFQPLIEYYFVKESTIAIIIFRLMFILILLTPFMLVINGKRPKLSKYRVFFLLVFSFNILTTILYLGFGFTQNYSNFGIYYGMLIGYFLSEMKFDVIRKGLNLVANLGLIIFPFIALYVLKDFDINVALRRGYTWTLSFYIAAIFWALIPFSLISFIENKKRIKPLLYIFAALFLNVIFIKRAIFIDISLILIAIVIHKILTKQIRLKTIIISTVSVVLAYALISNILNESSISIISAILERFSSSADDLSSFNRFVESGNYFKNINFFDFIIGKGYLSYHFGLGHLSYALHVGWMNWIFKGGILLFILVLIPHFKTLILFKKYRFLPIKIQFSILLIIVYSVYQIYSNLHSFTPNLIIYFYCLFSVMEYRFLSNHNNRSLVIK